MLFYIIVLVFIFIGFVAFFGDYKSKEIEKDYKKLEKMRKNKKKK